MSPTKAAHPPAFVGGWQVTHLHRQFDDSRLGGNWRLFTHPYACYPCHSCCARYRPRCFARCMSALYLQALCRADCLRAASLAHTAPRGVCGGAKLRLQDADATDYLSWHLFALDGNGQALATCRLIPAGHKYAEAAIGRVACALSVRGTGLGHALMQAAVRELARLSPGPVRISAQQRLQGFYESLGFVPASVPYLEDDIAHIEMLRN